MGRFNILVITAIQGLAVGALWCALIYVIFPDSSGWTNHLGHIKNPLFGDRSGWFPACVGTAIGSVASLAYGRYLSSLGALFALCSLCYVLKASVHKVVAGWAHINMVETWSAYLLVMSAGVFLAAGVSHLLARRRSRPSRYVISGLLTIAAFLFILWWPTNGDPYNPHRQDGWYLFGYRDPEHFNYGRPLYGTNFGVEWYSTVEWRKMTIRDFICVLSIGVLALAIPNRARD